MKRRAILVPALALAAAVGVRRGPLRIVEVWRATGPLNHWLARHVGPSTEPPPGPR